MSKSRRKFKITDDQINAISLELCHIEALVELLGDEADRARGPLVSGLMLITNQVERIDGMLNDVFHGRSRKKRATEEQKAAQ
jgi:hypothetical protein